MNFELEYYRLLREVEELRAKAFRNDLTRLPNRRACYKYLDEGTSECQAYFVLIDIDNFKKFNDDHGHAYGDEILCKVGDVLGSFECDLIKPFHLSGDEFFIVITELLSGLLDFVIDRINKRIQELGLSISWGIFKSEVGQCFDRGYILKECDKAMYKMKEAK